MSSTSSTLPFACAAVMALWPMATLALQCPAKSEVHGVLVVQFPDESVAVRGGASWTKSVRTTGERCRLPTELG